MPRACAAIALVILSVLAASCGDGEGDRAGQPGPSPREQFATALLKTRQAGSAAVVERVVSEPLQLEFEVSGRARFDYNEARLKVTHLHHPALAPGAAFHLRIVDASYVRRTNGRWYVPPYHSGEFELGYANFVHLLRRAYGQVRIQGARTLLVWMARDNLERLRTSAEGSVGPLGTLYDLLGPMRFELDERGRIERIEYTVTGRTYAALSPAHTVKIMTQFSKFDRDFDVERPPGYLITEGPLEPPQPGARADSSRL